MRNPFGVQPLLDRAYVEYATVIPGIPPPVVPLLLPMARPVHRVVKVDVYLPGCPPSADLIYQALVDLLEGRTPDTAAARFGR
jgi:NAD-reducing hydrogenase small subunit